MGILCGGAWNGQERWWAEPTVGVIHAQQMIRPHSAGLIGLERQGLSVRAEFLASAACVRGPVPGAGESVELEELLESPDGDESWTVRNLALDIRNRGRDLRALWESLTKVTREDEIS